MTTFQKIHQVVSQIPKGKVSTYKIIARQTNTNPRVVGFALHANKDPKTIPCHRVVKNDGSFAKGYAFGGNAVKQKKLKEEGVVFLEDEFVDLKQSLFIPQV